MDLWIRSQDKYTLEKVEALQICENPDGTYFFNSGLILGKYKTKERALEVLDEIQNILKPEVIVKPGKLVAQIYDDTFYKEPDEVEIKELSIVFYEMPKE